MTTVQLWAMVVGLFLPFVLGLLLKHSWANWLKFLIVVLVSAVVGVVSLAIAGDLHMAGPGDWALLIGAIVAASQVTFFWFIERVPGLKSWLYAHFVRD